MTIIEKKKVNGVMVYKVKADLTDEETQAMNGKLCTDRTYKDIIDHDADVYTQDGHLLLRFRKNVLPQNNVDVFYKNVIGFANTTTAARGACSGSKVKQIDLNKKIKSNVYGFFDRWTVFHKHMFKTLGIKPPFPVRVTRFTTEFPDKWAKMIPLIKNIDDMYKKLVPDSYKFQRACANETAFRIPDTAFTTITTNITTQMGCHRDSGNLKEAFGNLVVIEKGKYDGGYTGFPKYKVAVDVRTGDFLAMDVHELHGNTPIRLKSKDAERLSIVCYLRQGIWEKTKASKPEDVQKVLRTTRRISAKFFALKNKS